MQTGCKAYGIGKLTYVIAWTAARVSWCVLGVDGCEHAEELDCQSPSFAALVPLGGLVAGKGTRARNSVCVELQGSRLRLPRSDVKRRRQRLEGHISLGEPSQVPCVWMRRSSAGGLPLCLQGPALPLTPFSVAATNNTIALLVVHSPLAHPLPGPLLLPPLPDAHRRCQTVSLLASRIHVTDLSCAQRNAPGPIHPVLITLVFQPCLYLDAHPRQPNSIALNLSPDLQHPSQPFPSFSCPIYQSVHHFDVYEISARHSGENRHSPLCADKGRQAPNDEGRFACIRQVRAERASPHNTTPLISDSTTNGELLKDQDTETSMATMTASSPAISPPLGSSNNKQPSLPSLTTRSNNNRRTSQQRPMSSNLLSRRVSSYSSASQSMPPQSRPISTAFPAFHSSLAYASVRDFAYPWNHPMHYGPQAEESSPTPASERRLSDPEIGGWEDSRSSWSAGPPWMSEDTWSSSKDQLPARTYNDDGPPYSEDEDLQSPIVTTSRHRKRSERGRSPGAAGEGRGMMTGYDGDRIEHYRPTDDEELDGPGGEIETFTRKTKHRDSNFAKPINRDQSPYNESYEPVSEEYESDDDTRYSKDYSFTIASPDEEMHGKAVALFDFESEHENELPLREGQIILVSYRHGQGWLVAEDPVTGESGLVPEEFVRLERHIEGGLNGFNSIEPEEGDENSPTSNDGGSAATPTDANDVVEKQPAVQSTFSTSTRDFSPLPKSSKLEQDR